MSTAGGVCILSSLASSIVSYMQRPMLLLKCTCLSTGPAFVCFALVGFLGNEIDPSPRSGVDISGDGDFAFSFVHGGSGRESYLKIKTGETQERSPERQRLISLSSSFQNVDLMNTFDSVKIGV
jgi:hypothetical protein